MSALDIVRDHVAALRKRLGAADNRRLDAHFEGIAELEKKLSSTHPSCVLPEPPSENNAQLFPEPIADVHDAMIDLLGYAFTCDVTRVASYMFHGGASETIFSEIGQTSVHHNNTHDPSEPSQGLVRQAVTYNIDRLAYMLERFAAWEDGADSLLDNMVVYCSSDCSDGWSHSIKRQPVIVAGRGGGKLTYPGIHHRTNGRNISDILLSVLQVFDPDADSVGGGKTHSQTPFDELLT